MADDRTWAQRILDAHEKAKQELTQSGEQTQQDIRAAQLAYEDRMNQAQQQYIQNMDAVRQAKTDLWGQYAGGVEALIAERQKEIDRAKEVANAEYMASQKAGMASGLTHLASSLANLIAVGGFNASNQVYQNPAMDWMKKADQDRLVNRQRIDNMRERQRAVQQQLLQIRAQGASDIADLDLNRANQGYQHESGIASSRQNADLSAANIGMQTRQSAIQTGLQGTTASTQVEMQKAQMDQNERHFNAQMAANERHYEMQEAANLARSGYQRDKDGNIVPITDANGNPVRVSGTSRASGGGSSSSGNNYKVTVDGQEAVIRMGTETYKSAVLRGRNEIKKDVMEEAGFEGSWEEFVEAATSGRKIKNPKGRGKVENPYDKYSGIVSALDSDATDDDTIKDNTATIENYINGHTDTSTHFNKYLIDLANSGQIIATVDQSSTSAPEAGQAEEQAAAVASVTPSQTLRDTASRVGSVSPKPRAGEQPTREEIRDGRWVTVDTKTGQILYEGNKATEEEIKKEEQEKNAAEAFEIWKNE